MDTYEATRVVLSRIQALDPENAAKIMGLILIQDHGEKEMIRLAFGPEALLHSVVLKARKDLGLLPLSRQNSAPRLLSAPPPLAVSSPSWASPPSPFSRSNGAGSDEMQNPEEIHSPAPFYGAGTGGDLMDEFQLQDQLSFLNEQGPAANVVLGGAKGSELYFGDVAAECRSPGAGSDGLLFPYSMGWGGANGAHHRRSCSVADLCLGSDAGFGWKPCLYFARGYCKNGSSCRFLHGIPDDVSPGGKIDATAAAAVEQQCHEFLMRSKSQRASQLMASAFPYSPTGSVMPASPSSSSKCMSFLMQQQGESQRAAAAAAAAAALMLGGEEAHKFMGRARMESRDFGGLINPGSRQIYLTFPADSTFREEDVSNYFSIYGPVQDVRIPYQQKRMFGFVTFVYPETVKLILAKGNPHFVCDARVLVKPYKEKGKVSDKFRKPPQQQGERGDFSLCTTPTGMESRDPYDLQQLVSPGAGRMMYSGTSVAQEALLRRRLEEQQQAAEFQQAIELQGRRFMGLQLLDLKARTLASHMNPSITSTQEEAPPPPPTTTLTEDKNGGSAAGAAAAAEQVQEVTVNGGGAEREESGGEASPNEDSDFPESAEHNLPDSPFASPTKSSFTPTSFSGHEDIIPQMNTSSFKSCFFPIPRFSSGHGAVGM
ncbi:putative transcription factor C3H family [Dioscorea sansibarensis]